MQITHFKSAAMKAAVALIPSYTAAYVSDKMVWVVPTLAATSFFAATIGVKDEEFRRRVDEDHQDQDVSDHVDQVDGMHAETEGSYVDDLSIHLASPINLIVRRGGSEGAGIKPIDRNAPGLERPSRTIRSERFKVRR